MKKNRETLRALKRGLIESLLVEIVPQNFLLGLVLIRVFQSFVDSQDTLKLKF